jgi:hypothetical protein
VITSLANDKPDYAAMTPEQAKTMRGELGEWRNDLNALGALKSVNFQKVQQSGADLYVLVFEQGKADAAI